MFLDKPVLSGPLTKPDAKLEPDTAGETDHNTPASETWPVTLAVRLHVPRAWSEQLDELPEAAPSVIVISP